MSIETTAKYTKIFKVIKIKSNYINQPLSIFASQLQN